MSDKPFKRSWPARLWDVIKIILAILLVAFVLSKTNLTQLFALRNRISLAWLVIELALYIILTLLKAAQYYYLTGRRTGYPQVLNIVVIQNAVSNFLAAGAGIASYLALFRVEQGVKFSRVAVAFILAKIGDLISIWLFLFVSAILAWSQIGLLQNLVVILLAGIGIAILTFFLVILLRDEFVFAVGRMTSWLRLDRIDLVKRGMNILRALAEQEQGFVLRLVGTGTLFSLVYMFTTMSWIYASFLTFSFEIKTLPVVFVNALMQLVSYIPIQVFGGLGVNETAMIYLYGFFDFPRTELVAILLGQRLLFYIMNLAMLSYLPVYTLYLTIVLQGANSNKN